MREELGFLTRVSRPKLWAGLPVVFLTSLQVSGAVLTPLSVLQAILLSMPYCIFLYGINDMYDVESDTANDRKAEKGMEGLVLTENKDLVMKASVFVVITLFTTSLATRDLLNLAGLSLTVLSSYLYSVPPFRLKIRPPLDSITNGFIYFLGPSLMGYSYGASISSYPIQALWVMATGIGFHAYTTIMDHPADLEAGDTTFAVRFGKRQAAAFTSLTFLATLIFSGIQNILVQANLVLGTALSSFTVLRPKPTIAEKSAKLMFLAAMLSAAAFAATI